MNKIELCHGACKNIHSMQNLFKDMPQYKKDLKVCQVCNSFQKYEKNHKQVFKRTLEHEEENNTKV